MNKLETFDPALCCSSGTYDTEVDEALLAFSRTENKSAVLLFSQLQ